MHGNLATADLERTISPVVAVDEMRRPVNNFAPHVLVVDDEALIRWSVAETLTTKGIRVSQASDGASAIKALALQPNPFDVAVLDLRLPDVSDLWLLSKVRELSPGTRVIMMTAFGTPEIKARAIDLGASTVIPKPFELEELAGLVERAIRRL